MLDRRHFTALALGVSLAALAGPAFAQPPLPVVASFSILGDMTKEIGGSHVEVKTLVGPNGDAHVFEPTPADAKALGGARLLVTNGLHFEVWLPRLVKSAGFEGETVVVSKGVAPQGFRPGFAEEEEGHDADHGHEDPHAWQNLANGVIYAQNIIDALKKADPGNAADYDRDGQAYIAELKRLDAEVRRELAAIPEAGRKVVTSHDAFGYFAAAYEIDFIAPNGVSTESEASAADVAKIIDQIRAEKIRAVFLENVSDPRLMRRIASETDARIGGELFSDALSEPDGPAPTYAAMFRNNVRELLKALKTS